MTGLTEIYVALLDESVDVWRPVLAKPLYDDVYRIVDQPYDRADERWQFEPGDDVVCAPTEADGVRILAAIRTSKPTP